MSGCREGKEGKDGGGAAPPRVILGLWPMAGITSIGVEDTESIATIRRALECGVRWFDTAYSYGYEGRSDLVLRRALEGWQGQVEVVGKVGQRWDANRRRYVDGRPETLIGDAEESLRRTGVDRFRYLLLHQPDPAVPVAESAEALLECQRRGWAEEIGICNATIGEMEAFATVAPVAATQFGFNMVQPQPSAAVREWSARHGVAGLAYWILMKGLLAGRIGRDYVFPPGDSRPTYDVFKPPMRERTHDLVDRLAEVAGRLGVPVSALVVAWSIRQKGVSSALVGALHPAQIEESAQAMRVELTDERLGEIQGAIDVWMVAEKRGSG